MQPDILGDILRSPVPTIPSILAYLVGILWALAWMRKAPTAAVLVVLSLIGFGLLSISQPFVFGFVSSMEDRVKWFPIVSLMFRLAYLAATAGLVCAVFCDRGTSLENVSPYAQQFGYIPPNPNPYAASKPLPSQ
jgi:hypothetical protein